MPENGPESGKMRGNSVEIGLMRENAGRRTIAKADEAYAVARGAFEVTELSGMIAIEARNIAKSFGATPVLKGVSLAARKGEAVAIIGASGSGKSTFLRCLNLLEMPDLGEVHAGGERITIGPGGQPPARAQIERIRRSVAMVFQGFNLWHHMTVLGNVIEAPIHVHGRPRAEAIEEAQALLAKVGLTPSRARLSGAAFGRRAAAGRHRARPCRAPEP